MNSERRFIVLPERPESIPLSDGVLVGSTLYISGRIGIDPATGVVPPELGKELKFLFDGFASALKQAGMSWDDLVWVQVFAPDLTLWERFNEEYVKHFKKDFPARAFLGTASLLRNGRFEMMGIAQR